MARGTVDPPTTRVTIAVIPDSAAAVAEAVRDARSTRTSLRITGARQWLDAGRPCTATSELSLAALRGVIEYERGDFTITVQKEWPSVWRAMRLDFSKRTPGVYRIELWHEGKVLGTAQFSIR